MPTRRPRHSDPTWLLLRRYLMLVVPILLLMLLRPEHAVLGHIRGINLTSITAWLVALALISLVTWKAYREFWRNDDRT